MASDLPRGLIVSCQAEGDSPFNAPEFIAAFARAAEMGGAVGRAHLRSRQHPGGARRPRGCRSSGLTKGRYDDGSVLVTPGIR